MNWDTEKCIDSYYGKYKNGILGKKSDIKLAIYPSKIEGMGFSLCDNKLSKDTISFKIPYSDILKICIEEVNNQTALLIEYNTCAIAKNKKFTIALLGIDNIQNWYNLIEKNKKIFLEEKILLKRQLEIQHIEEQRKLADETEKKSIKFF